MSLAARIFNRKAKGESLVQEWRNVSSYFVSCLQEVHCLKRIMNLMNASCNMSSNALQ